jgi:lysozyme
MSTQLPEDISLKGLNETRAEEGRALRAYQDPVHVWTVGYGLTNYDKGLPWKVGAGLVITEQQAEWYLLKSLRENYLPAVRSTLQGGTYAHPQGVVDGGCDFHFNTGGIKKATWPRLLGAGNLAAAKVSMESWNKAGGRVLSDLVGRRAHDWQMVSTGTYPATHGPINVIPGSHNQETYKGYGDVLTAFPTDPNDTAARTVATAEPPKSPGASGPGTLKAGDTGPDVTKVQTKLNDAGMSVPLTGVFDQKTIDAVKQFQNSHPNLGTDGVVGPATDAALDRAKNMRTNVSRLGKAAVPSLPAAFIGLHQFVSDNAGWLALGLGALVVLGVAGYIIWRYQHDFDALINKWRGITTP